MNAQRIFLSPPHLADDTVVRVTEAIQSNYVAYPGPHITQFEDALKAYTGAPHAAALASGTAALHLALLQCGVGPGDRVLTSDLTFIGSINPILHCGAEPVLIDSEPRTWNMDPACLAKALEVETQAGRRPKAVLVVHLYGLPADLDPINELCRQYNVPLIEDASEALGCFYKGRHVGNDGQYGVFSFNGNKMITNGGGGMLVSPSEEGIHGAVHLATQARDPAPYYLHTKSGYNYRMSNILAAVGLSQMGVLEERVQARRRIYASYCKRFGTLPGVSLMPDCDDFARATHWLSCIVLDATYGEGAPEKIRQALEQENIETRRIWKPMHTQPLLKEARFYDNGFSAELFERGLCLPSGSSMSEADLDRVCDALEGAIKAL